MSKKPTIEERLGATQKTAQEISRIASDVAPEKIDADLGADLAKLSELASQKKYKRPHLSLIEKTRATYHVTQRLQSSGLKPLEKNELISVYSLLAWVANQQGAAEETVRSMTEVRFNVQNVVDLQKKDFDDVIEFLVDLRIDEMRH